MLSVGLHMSNERRWRRGAGIVWRSVVSELQRWERHEQVFTVHLEPLHLSLPMKYSTVDELQQECYYLYYFSSSSRF